MAFSTRPIVLAALGSGLLGSGLAGATNLEFGVSYAPSGGTVLQDGLLRFGVSDVQLAGFGLAAGVGSRGLDAAVTRSLVLPGLGAARLRADGAVLYSGSVRGGLNLSGTLGPVALTLAGSAWNAAPSRFDPLARWAETAPDLRGSGAAATIAARYRLNRNLVLNASGTLGGQSSVLAQAELRQGDVSYRFGARAGQNVLGAAAGVTYTNPDSGLNLSLDGLAGPGTLGLTARVGADGLLGDGSSLNIYGAFEPWRTVSEPLRVGAQLGLPVGTGTLNLEGYGGTIDRAGGVGLGFKVGYLLSLDPAPAEDAPSPDPAEPGPAEPAPTQP
jgi:hypothetical protein